MRGLSPLAEFYTTLGTQGLFVTFSPHASGGVSVLLVLHPRQSEPCLGAAGGCGRMGPLDPSAPGTPAAFGAGFQEDFTAHSSHLLP